MATDIKEVTTETSENGTGKRKRVNVAELAAQNPLEKIQLAISVPAEMRVKLREAAEAQNKSEAEFARDTLASAIGYHVPDQFTETRRRGLSDDEKAELTAQKRKNVSDLLSVVQANAADNPALAELLAQAGIDISMLPKTRGPRAPKSES